MKIGLPLAALALALAAPASAAVTISDYSIVFSSGSAIVTSGGKTSAGEYQDNFHFTIAQAATFSGSLSTQRLRDSLGDLVSDLDFGNSLVPGGVHLDGFSFDVASGGTDSLEVQNLATTFLLAGDHVLTVNYRVQEASAINAAAYAGPLFLATSPVPEPASWMLMLIGVGTVGVAMRRSPKRQVSFA